MNRFVPVFTPVQCHAPKSLLLYALQACGMGVPADVPPYSSGPSKHIPHSSRKIDMKATIAGNECFSFFQQGFNNDSRLDS